MTELTAAGRMSRLERLFIDHDPFLKRTEDNSFLWLYRPFHFILNSSSFFSIAFSNTRHYWLLRHLLQMLSLYHVKIYSMQLTPYGPDYLPDK